MTNLRASTVTLIAVATLSGCAGQTVSLGSDDPCAALQAVIADYPTGFAQYRGKASNYNLLTVYRAKEELVNGHCEIWAWDQADVAYACNVAAPTAEVAQQRQERTNQFVSSCLGEDWKRETRQRSRDDKFAGSATRYSRPGTEAVVSVHSITRTEGPGERRQTSLYIGSPGRVDQLTK